MILCKVVTDHVMISQLPYSRFLHTSRAVGREFTEFCSSVSTSPPLVRSASIFDFVHLFRASAAEGAGEVPSTRVHKGDLLRKREATVLQLY